MARRPDQLSAQEETLLHDVTRTVTSLFAAWESELVRRHGLSRVEFSVLHELEQSDDHACAISPLATAGQQSLSAMSRTVARLEQRGYVERQRDDADGRATRAVLTEAGAAKLAEAQRDHRTNVRRTLLDHLDGVDLAAVIERLERIRRASGNVAD